MRQVFGELVGTIWASKVPELGFSQFFLSRNGGQGGVYILKYKDGGKLAYISVTSTREIDTLLEEQVETIYLKGK